MGEAIDSLCVDCGKEFRTQDKDNAERCIDCSIEYINLKHRAHRAFDKVVKLKMRNWGMTKKKAREWAFRWLGVVLGRKSSDVRINKLCSEDLRRIIDDVERKTKEEVR